MLWMFESETNEENVNRDISRLLKIWEEGLKAPKLYQTALMFLTSTRICSNSGSTFRSHFRKRFGLSLANEASEVEKQWGKERERKKRQVQFLIFSPQSHKSEK